MKLEALFSEWKAKYRFQAFIRDGIVDPACYARPHILFVLRDMNCQTERDLCADLRCDGSGWKTWNNVGRWTKALLDGSKEYPWDMSRGKRVEQVRRIAVLNLKKEGGRARTEGAALLGAVEEQRDMIYQEICLCEPDLLICCGLPGAGIEGNADLLRNYVFSEVSEWASFPSKTFDRDWFYYLAEIEGKRVPVLSFCHPQATNLNGRRGHEKLFRPLYEDMLYVRELFLGGSRLAYKYASRYSPIICAG